MALPIRPAYAESSGTPSIQHRTIGAAQTFKIGAPLKSSAGLAVEATSAADAAANLIGFSNTIPESTFGFGAADSPATVTGRENTVAVIVGNRSTVFYGQISTGTSALVAPAVSDIGVAYGLVKQADGYWTVNRSDTTNLAVTVTAIDTSVDGPGRVYFKIRQASLAA